MAEDTNNQTTTPEAGNAAPAVPPGGSTAPEVLLGGEAASGGGNQNDTLLGGDSATNGEEKGQTGEDAPKTTEGAPEKYEFKAPEGLELDSGMVEEFSPIAKELNLTNEQAQKLVDLYSNQVLKTQKASLERWDTMVSGWKDSSKSDAEFGGKNFDSSLEAAKKALKFAGTPELNALLAPPSPENPTGMGLGNHPEIIRLLARIGKTIGEDNQHIQANQAPAVVSAAKILFPDMK